MAKTIAEINEKIKKGQAVVVTAEEIIDIAKKKGVSQTAKEVDVVTTGTTLLACTQVLKSAGVKQVHVATLAHGY